MTYAVCDGRVPECCRDGIRKIGMSLLELKPHRPLPCSISSHTDILIFYSGNEIISSRAIKAKNQKLFHTIEAEFPHIKLRITKQEPGCEYPTDAIFNALVVKDKIFMRQKSVAAEILHFAEEKGLSIVNVNQGYPACTVLAFGGSAITADLGMAKALSAQGIRTTLISTTEKISLSPHKYGFIGGCTGILNRKIYFLGNLDAHPDCAIIKKAIAEEGYEWESLAPSATCLFDLGRIYFFQKSIKDNSENRQ